MQTLVRDAFRQGTRWAFISLVPWAGLAFVASLFLARIPDADAKAEEVRAIWQRELARNVREARAAAQAADGADKFDEAMED